MNKNQFTIRDLIWAFIVAALLAGMVRQEMMRSLDRERFERFTIYYQQSREKDADIRSSYYHSIYDHLNERVRAIEGRPSLAPEVQQLHVLIGDLHERAEVRK